MREAVGAELVDRRLDETCAVPVRPRGRGDHELDDLTVVRAGVLVLGRADGDRGDIVRLAGECESYESGLVRVHRAEPTRSTWGYRGANLAGVAPSVHGTRVGTCLMPDCLPHRPSPTTRCV